MSNLAIIPICVHRSFNKNTEVNLHIESNVFINRNVIIESFNKTEIGKYVIFGPQLYLSDNNHEYRSPYLPIALQNIMDNNTLKVRDGAWIGAGSRVVSNLNIGFGSVIGANSVITKDVSDHVVIAGNPAQIIKVCDYRTQSWIYVKDNPALLKDIIDNRGEFEGYNYELIESTLNKLGWNISI
nr:acyltransferase [Paenibacillus sp. URB8-2]